MLRLDLGAGLPVIKAFKDYGTLNEKNKVYPSTETIVCQNPNNRVVSCLSSKAGTANLEEVFEGPTLL